jgi:hypothetical protein
MEKGKRKVELAPGHISNITDEIILTVTPSTILSVSLSRHCTICLFESRCNSIGNCVCKNLHAITLFGCFIPFIPTAILSVYIDDIFLLVFINEISDKKIQSANIIVKYQ